VCEVSGMQELHRRNGHFQLGGSMLPDHNAGDNTVLLVARRRSCICISRKHQAKPHGHSNKLRSCFLLKQHYWPPL